MTYNLDLAKKNTTRFQSPQVNTTPSESKYQKRPSRILVISDIHGNIDALRRVFKEETQWDSLIFAGDAVGYGASPNEVISELKQQEIIACMGNHDFAVISLKTDWFNEYAVKAIRWTNKTLTVDSKSWLANLPSRKEFNIGSIRVGLVHGSPRKPLYEYVTPDTPISQLESHREEMDVDILILGHTHIPFIQKLPGGIILNPGSVGQPRDGDPRASYIILEIDEDEVQAQIHRIKYPIRIAASRIKEAGLPRFLGER
ncbi:MAG: metallophosphoesterase family protein, partial [Candidatus Ranarchaeia archaeon]